MDRIWVKNYQKGVPENVEHEIESYNSIPEILEESFNKFSNSPAFTCMGKTLTYGEIDEQSKRFASYLQNELKLPRGARVALMMPNILQYPIALFGVLRGGYVAVNVNPLYTARELEHQLKDSGSVAIVIFENACHTLEQVIANTPVKHVFVTSIGDMLGFPKSMIVNFVIKNVKKMVPAWKLDRYESFVDVLKKSTSNTYAKVSLKHDDIAFLQYTGGTTGVAKGAVLTQKNMVANLCQARAWISPYIEVGKEVIITPLPLYHIFSLTANCFTFSTVGGHNILITNPRDIPGFIKELKKYPFTAITGVNTLFNALLNHPDFKTVNFSTLKLTLGGGMAVQKAVAEKWRQVTSRTLVEAYGLTETAPAACINPLDLKEYNGFIGLPISSTIVKIKDDFENDVNIGEIGEICIKGPQVMQGYWNRPDETQKVMTKDGFFKTGDMGFMNTDGYVKIVDRKKDMILVSGFNVYPNEVEDVVCLHPKVFECAAVGMPDEKSGEVVKVYIVKKDETLTSEEVIHFCRENLTNYKVPKAVEFRKELPKSNVGKILRKDLR